MTTPCTCLAEIDAKLAETGHYLDATILAATLASGGVDKPLITIMRKDKWIPETRRGKQGKFIPSFCPFCGVRYPEAQTRACEPATPTAQVPA